MFHLIVWVLVIEVGVLFVFILMSIAENFYLKLKKDKELMRSKSLSELVMESLHKNDNDNDSVLQYFPKKLENSYSLLSVLEAFNSRFQGGRFLKLKEELSNYFLLPLARKKAKSKSWINRHYAARCFALCPLKTDIPLILSLIKDSIFLVHSTAALAAVRLESLDGILTMLQRMSQEKSDYSKCFYRDLLMQSSYQVFQYIEKVAVNECDEKIHLICLDILSTKEFPVTQDLLERDLVSVNPKVRYATLKIYSHNPQKNSEDVLLHAIASPDFESRIEASYGLGRFSSEHSLKALEKALSDLCLPVRLQAAKSLKKIGVKGIAILNQQKSQGSQSASEMANYVLEFS